MLHAALYCGLDTYQDMLYDALELFQGLHQASDIHFSLFYKAEELQSLHADGMTFDLYLIDVAHQHGRGQELAAGLQRQGMDRGLILLSSAKGTSGQDVMLSSDQNALALPCGSDKLFRVIEQKLKYITEDTLGKLRIDTNKGPVYLRLYDIVFIEYQDRRMIYYLENGKKITSKTIRTSFGEELDALPDNPAFIRCHSAFYVNMNRTVWLSKKDFSTYNGTLIPVSKRRYVEVRQAFRAIEQNRRARTMNVNAAIVYGRNYEQQLQFWNKLPMAAAITRIDMDQGGGPFNMIFVYVNDTFCAQSGLTREELLGGSLFDVFPRADRRYLDEYGKVAFKGENMRMVIINEKISHQPLTMAAFQPAYGYCGFVVQRRERKAHYAPDPAPTAPPKRRKNAAE